MEKIRALVIAALKFIRRKIGIKDTNLDQTKKSLARKYVDVVYCKDYMVIMPRGGTKKDE